MQTYFPTKMHFPQKRSLKGHWSGYYGQTGQSLSCECVFVCMYGGGGGSGNMKPAGREWSLGVVRALVQRIISPMEQL